MSDQGCFWHGDEPLHEDHTTLCYECGHAFTTAELIAEDLRVRQDIHGGDDETCVQPRTIEEIFVCPLCAHDL